MLALRDELASRPFDAPGAWWPAQPRVVGGRDRLGGGTWCASDVASGVTAVVLNRPDKPVAAPGAPSRGMLPLLAVRELERWPDGIDLSPMASFNLVLAAPDALKWWSYDGSTLLAHSLSAGPHMFTPRGIAWPLPDERFARGRARLSSPDAPSAAVWADWLPAVEESEPSEDPLALLVRIPHGADTFETVFGQFIAAQPGSLRLDYAFAPGVRPTWTLARWDIEADAAEPAR